MSNSTESTSSLGSFFTKLANGDFGLAKTYWLFGVAAGFVLNVTLRGFTSVGVVMLLFLIYTAYMAFVFLGVWRASDKYTGRKVWAVLAKVATVLGVVFLSLGLLLGLGTILGVVP